MGISKNELIRYYYVEELSIQEIANYAECSTETIRNKRKTFKLPDRKREWSDFELAEAKSLAIELSNGANLEADMRSLAFKIKRSTKDVRKKISGAWLAAFAPHVQDYPGVSSLIDLSVPSLKVRKIDPNAILPQYANYGRGSAGLDLRAISDYNIGSNDKETIWTGIAIEIPFGYAGLVCPRSGLAAKEGITVLNAPGIIDPDYRGNDDQIGVILYNTGSKHENYHVETGDKVAQLVIVPAPHFDVVEVQNLSGVNRDGFGSTGKK